MALTPPDLLGPIMSDLLECADKALQEHGRPARLVHLAPGQQVAWDNCCDGQGQLWVRVISAHPSVGPNAPFPAVDAQQSCGVSALAAVLGVGVMRCAHTIDDRGDPPSASEMTADTLDTTRDMSILLRAVQCCFLPDRRPTPKVGQWTPQGVMGGCVGGEWQVTVPVGVCDCPPPVEG